MKTTPHPEIDWALLLKKVHAVALNLFRKQGLLAGDNSVLKGLGLSPKDFAQAAMMEFFKQRDRYTATTEGQCFAIIVTILKRDFLDAVTKKHAYTKTDEVH
jgi:DNA-directed RNA polymerase specialized sigma24 family protein